MEAFYRSFQTGVNLLPPKFSRKLLPKLSCKETAYTEAFALVNLPAWKLSRKLSRNPTLTLTPTPNPSWKLSWELSWKLSTEAFKLE